LYDYGLKSSAVNVFRFVSALIIVRLGLVKIKNANRLKTYFLVKKKSLNENRIDMKAIIFFSFEMQNKIFLGRHDTQDNDTQHNNKKGDTQHNNTQRHNAA
jgi:hypothetical protein